MKTVLIKIEEWTAWMPTTKKTPASGGLALRNGITSVDVEEDWKLIDIQVMDTGKEQRLRPTGGEKEEAVHCTLYAFQAQFAKSVPGIDKSQVPEFEPDETYEPKPGGGRRIQLATPGDMPKNATKR